MIAQMVGAGALVTLLLGSSHVSYQAAVIGVGVLMIIYVVFGGMLATTWVQIIKAILLMAGTILLSLLVLAHFGWSLANFFDAVTRVTYHDKGALVTKNFLEPGLRYTAANHGALDLISLGMALVFGTAGLPHILVRFYTVPDAKTARVSVVWAMVLIGSFYIMTTFLGFGAATIVGRDQIAAHGGNNMSAPLLAQALGGDIFFAFIAAIAFATILAVVAGLTISASTSFAHDFYTAVIHKGTERRPGEEVRVARITAFCRRRGRDRDCNPAGQRRERRVSGRARLCRRGLGQSCRSSCSRFSGSASTPPAQCWDLATGLIASLVLIMISPSIMKVDPPTVVASARHLIQRPPIFPLENPGILSIPLGFLGAMIGTFLRREPAAEARFAELIVRANTGLGSEKAVLN